MKGIILHGGHGTRLRPLTHTGPKQLLPIANKPMSQYCIESLRDAGITDIAIIIGGVGSNKVREYYGNGSSFGVNITFIEQDEPRGIAHAINLCKNFVNKEKFVVFLGDNIMTRPINDLVKKFEKSDMDSLLLLCNVDNPSQFGIAEIQGDKIIKITEKPKNPKSNLAVTGLYFFDNKVINFSKKLKPSKRKEIEITDLLNKYLKKRQLKAEFIGRGGSWLDAGSIGDFYKASNYVNAVENRQGLKIACIEEIAFNKKWISKKEIINSIKFYGKCDYSKYLRDLIK